MRHPFWKLGVVATACVALAGCGEEEAPVVTEKIGSAGGTLVSADERMRVEFPDGALAGETKVAIVRVKNDAPYGIGHAYRIEPADLSLQKPVKVVFDKGEESEVAVAIAWSDFDGWFGLLDARLDRFNAELSIETKTLGTWSLFQMLQVSPQEATVRPGGQEFLDVRICVEDSPGLFESVFISPIVSCSPWSQSNRVVGWEVNGVQGGHELFGSVEADGHVATYTAPMTAPDGPVWVTAMIDIPGRPEGGLGAPIKVAAE